MNRRLLFILLILLIGMGANIWLVTRGAGIVLICSITILTSVGITAVAVSGGNER